MEYIQHKKYIRFIAAKKLQLTYPQSSKDPERLFIQDTILMRRKIRKKKTEVVIIIVSGTSSVLILTETIVAVTILYVILVEQFL